MRLLANRDLRLGDDSGEAVLDRRDLVAVVAAQLLERRPALSLKPDVLPLVGTDEADIGWRAGHRELGAAGDADRILHAFSSTLDPTACGRGRTRSPVARRRLRTGHKPSDPIR